LAVVADLVPGSVVEGPLLPEPVEVLVVVPIGASVKLIGKGLRTGRVHEPILDATQIGQLPTTPREPLFNGDASKFKLGVEAAGWALLSPARGGLRQLLKLPRIRFPFADDPGKTIMAGLLLKELKIRGLVPRTLIVAPANLTFQWQRETKDKFHESFDVMRGEVLRTSTDRTPGRSTTRW
jgi:hypothetical protein